MSLLLDALNKADEERKRNENPPSIGSNHDTSLAIGTTGNKVPVFTIAASIGVVLAILLVVVYWLGRHTLVINTTNEAASTPKTAASNVADNVQTTNTRGNVQTKNSPSNTTQSNSANNNAAVNYNNTAPTKTRSGDAPSEESVANLYQQNTAPAVQSRVQPGMQSTVQPTNALATNPTTRIDTNIQPAKTEPTNPQVISSIKQFPNLPEIHDLPNNVLERIPSLNYSAHHYNSNGGDVVINGGVKHANDQLANGLVIDKILEDGMVLHIDTYSFKMRALNSWVNM